MATEQFTIRPATTDDDPAIAGLVVEGFIDKFRPIFGEQGDQSLRIMEKWVELEHSVGGVRSLVIEGASPQDLAAGVGVRVEKSLDEVLARDLWRVLQQNLGLLKSLWASTLLSYPRYTTRPAEAYIERLVVSPDYRRQGMARDLLAAAEELARERGKKDAGLHVSGNNAPAIKLYEAEGYEEVSRQRSFLTSHFLGIRDWIYLRKTL
ncbi:MAG: GNAT family N-acetyltransferase [Rubrobacteraceae bacterium]